MPDLKISNATALFTGKGLAKRKVAGTSFQRPFTQRWLPTLDTLRNFFLMPTAEMPTVFQTVRGQVSRIRTHALRPIFPEKQTTRRTS